MEVITAGLSRMWLGTGTGLGGSMSSVGSIGLSSTGSTFNDRLTGQIITTQHTKKSSTNSTNSGMLKPGCSRNQLTNFWNPVDATATPGAAVVLSTSSESST